MSDKFNLDMQTSLLKTKFRQAIGQINVPPPFKMHLTYLFEHKLHVGEGQKGQNTKMPFNCGLIFPGTDKGNRLAHLAY